MSELSPKIDELLDHMERLKAQIIRDYIKVFVLGVLCGGCGLWTVLVLWLSWTPLPNHPL